MKILLDMNLTPAGCEVLATAGHEAEHWSHLGPPDATDEEILDFARRGGWVVVTQDLDFGSLLALRGHDLPSVIQVRAHATLPSDIGKQLLDTISAHPYPTAARSPPPCRPAAYAPPEAARSPPFPSLLA